jgi:CRP-like cAMP-binding protein
MKSMPMDKGRLSALRGVITFRFLDPEEAEELGSQAELISCEKGDTLVTEGEVSPYFFGILEGSFSVSVKETEGKPVYISTLGPGDVFGESGIFMKVRRTATVTALERALVLRLHRGQIIRFIRQHPEAGNKIMLVIIFGLLRKLDSVNQELAFERKSDLGQADIDAMMEGMLSEGGIA